MEARADIIEEADHAKVAITVSREISVEDTHVREGMTREVAITDIVKVMAIVKVVTGQEGNKVEIGKEDIDPGEITTIDKVREDIVRGVKATVTTAKAVTDREGKVLVIIAKEVTGLEENPDTIEMKIRKEGAIEMIAVKTNDREGQEQIPMNN